MAKKKEVSAAHGALPGHVAIIMDGNGRWAKRRMLPRKLGHRAGVERLKEIVRYSSDIGIKVLTVYAFSTENWKRPKDEVDALIELFIEFLNKEIDELNRNNVKLSIIGAYEQFPARVQQSADNALRKTSQNTGLVLNIALNYGGRSEIATACKKIAQEVEKGLLSIEEIDEETVLKRLYTADLIEPDLIIRTGGEMRLSNFLLYQSAYSEMYFTDVLWADFKQAELDKAIHAFGTRNRRFGNV